MVRFGYTACESRWTVAESRSQTHCLMPKLTGGFAGYLPKGMDKERVARRSKKVVSPVVMGIAKFFDV